MSAYVMEQVRATGYDGNGRKAVYAATDSCKRFILSLILARFCGSLLEPRIADGPASTTASVMTIPASGIPMLYRGHHRCLDDCRSGWGGLGGRRNHVWGRRCGKASIQEIIAGVAARRPGSVFFTRTRPSKREQSLPVVSRWIPTIAFRAARPRWLQALVTPYVLEYGSRRTSATYAADSSSHSMWASDESRIRRTGRPMLLAGWAVGGLSGWFAHSRDVPLTIQLLPHGAAIGLSKRF